MRQFIPGFFSIMILQACTNAGTGEDQARPGPETIPMPTINYSLLVTYPHDTTSFTEGLFFREGLMYESTGSPDDLPQTSSGFGIFDSLTGKIDARVKLDREKYFGEGICFLNNRIYQLTYQTGVGFIYDAGSFEKIGKFRYPGKEGWGMTTDSTHLILSDGTNTLYFLNPTDFKTAKTVYATDQKGSLLQLNELEYIGHYIYANVYETNSIVKIDPVTGKITGILDLGSLAAEAKYRYPHAMEMNGIAYDPVSRKLYITGKMWPTLYGIQFVH